MKKIKHRPRTPARKGSGYTFERIAEMLRLEFLTRLERWADMKDDEEKGIGWRVFSTLVCAFEDLDVCIDLPFEFWVGLAVGWMEGPAAEDIEAMIAADKAKVVTV